MTEERERKGLGLPAFREWPLGPITDQAPAWTVLRCPGQRTLAMAQELRDMGLTAWAPSTRYQKRLPRSRKTQWVVVPLLPSFIFIAAPEADEAISQMDRVSIFLVNDKRPLIPGVQLLPLQEAQTKGMGADMVDLAPGTRVEVLSGLFGHQRATIIRSKGRGRFQVQMDGHLNGVVLPGFLLRSV